MNRALLEHIGPRLDAFLADLATLVDIDCGSRSKIGVDAVGARLRRRLEQAGMTVETIPVKDYGDCLHARLAGRGTARILLLGHLDTVYPDGTAAERPMSVRGDRIFGPGTNDMKAGLLAAVYAIEALRAVGFDGFGELGLFCNSEEEVGSPVSRGLYADEVRAADAVFVLEAARADGAIVSARKGGGRFRLSVAGHAAHAGVEPEKGANAVHDLAHKIVALQGLNEVRPGTTVSVGVVAGGDRANVVPDAARAEIDVRVVELDDIPVIEAALADIAATVHVPGTTATLAGRIGRAPMATTEGVRMLVDLARTVAADLGFDLPDVATGGMSDANAVSALGRPVLDGLGPVGGLDHSPDEYVDLDSIVPRTALLAGLIRATCANAPALRAVGEGAGGR